MLKLKSALFGLCVTVQFGYALTGNTPCRANDELLPDFADEVRGVATGSEKSCASDLPVPGVSFPTRFYAQHAAAYGPRLISLVPVQAGLLPETASDGGQKSENLRTMYGDEIQIIAKSAGRDMPSEIGVVSELKPRGWRAAKPRRSPVNDMDFETGEFSAIVSESTSEDFESPLQTVAYQDAPAVEEPAPLVSEIPSTVTDKPVVEQNSADGLFSSLGHVNLGDAIHSANELPDTLNEGKEYLSKAGTQRNWSSGTWVSFRPRRNTFPFHHNPLYFEDPNLERCGRTSGYFTEVTSFAHFAGRIPVLPYMMTVEPPCSLVHAKPDCPTCSEFGPDAYFPNPDEVDLGGASIQAAAVVGLIFLIP
jgi:hypothetical protein